MLDEFLVCKFALEIKLIAQHVKRPSGDESGIITALNTCDKHNGLADCQDRVFILLLRREIVHKTLLIASQHREFLMILEMGQLQPSSSVQHFLIEPREHVFVRDDVAREKELAVLLVVVVVVVNDC